MESLLWSMIGVLPDIDRYLFMSPKKKLLNTAGDIPVSHLKFYNRAIV